MAFPHVWSATEDNQPTGSTPIGQGDDYIVATRQMIRERIGLEHNFDFTNDAEQGSHREGSARVWVSETEPEDPIPAVTAETVGQLKKGRFWFKPSTGEAFVYDLGTAAWKAINITGAQLIGLVTALSAKSTVAAADKILILDSSAGGAGKLITADKFATAAQGAKADAALPASSYTAADVLTKIKTVDGAGSGLDADTVDGQQASAFQPASSAINTSNIGSQSVSNADTVDGQHASAFATAAQGVKADNALPAASYTAADVLAKVKTVDGVGSGLDADTVDSLHANEFATAEQGAKADAALPAASYTAEDILTKIETVDGADSGLDADLLDGNHASAFALAGAISSLDSAIATDALLSGVYGAHHTWSSDHTSTNSTSYIKKLSFRCPFRGSARVVWHLECADVSGAVAYGRIYKNGVAYGAEHSVNKTAGSLDVTEDVSSISAGDTIEIWLKASVSYAYLTSMTIKAQFATHVAAFTEY